MFHIDHSDGAHGSRLITDQPFRSGQRIYWIEGAERVRTPTYQTIQIGPSEHLDGLGKIAYLNHACRPNTFVDTSTLTVTAIRDIEAGGMLTYFYPATEWEMTRPFLCRCATPECLRLIAGARFLSVDVLSRYRLNDHILRLAEAALRGTPEATHPSHTATPSSS